MALTGLTNLQPLHVHSIGISTFDGSVSVGGTLTYEDVTNIDSVGIVTARTGIKVLAGGINVVGVVTATSFVGSGANLTGISQVGGSTGVDFNDNVKIRLGTGNDLEIFHDGSTASIIKTKTGDQLSLQSDLFWVRNSANSESIIKGIADGAVEIYFNGSKKIETTNSGVTLNGTAHLVNSGNFYPNSDGSIQLGLSNRKWSTINGVTLNINGGDAEFRGTTPGTTDMTWDQSENALNFDDNVYAHFGTGDDLKIYHDGSDSYLRDSGTGHLNITSSQVNILNPAANEAMAKFISDGAVELYYDSSKKAETFGSGFKVSSGGELYIDGNAAGGHCQLIMTRSDMSYMISNETFLRIYRASGNSGSPNTLTAEFTNSGHFRPGADNTYDLGDSTRRWRNLYTTDLQLSNKGKTNDVDGTWGDWTLQEGEDKIFMINNRTGKKYSLKMEEE